MSSKPRRPTSVAAIVTLALIAVTAVLLVAFGTVAYGSFRSRQWDLLRRQHAVLADQLAVGLALPVWNFDREQIDRILEGALGNEAVSAVVVRLSDVGSTIHAKGRLAGWRMRALPSASAKADLLVETRKIVAGQGDVGTVEVYVTPWFVQATLRRVLLATIAVVALVGTLLVASFFLLFRRLVLAPLREVERFATAVTAGDGPRPSLAAGRYIGELESLRASLESMVVLLEARYRDLQASEAEVRHLNDSLERRVAERTAALRESEARLAAASRTKSEFVANISHEIRTPMNAVIGLTHLLQQTELGPKQREHLDRIGTSSQQLLAVINQVLDFSKIEAGRLELDDVPFRLDGVVQGAIGLVASEAEAKGLALRREIAPGLPAVVRGDPLRMGQVLTNLVGNAVKFTERGEVAVLVDVPERGEAHVKVRVRVRDTGIGMTPAERAKLFTAFVQADGSTTRQYGGTGLGLVISKRLVEQMGGELSVESSAGVGSAFTFVVPLSVGTESEAPPPEAALPEAPPPPDAQDTALAGARILLVEDNAINQQVGQAILEAAGAEVEIAANGQEATRAVAERGERFDAIVMDVQMPGMDGYAATRAIRRDPRGARIPIIAMTGHAFESERHRCEEAGMNDFIPKPMDPDLLVAVIARWRDRAAAPGFGPPSA